MLEFRTLSKHTGVEAVGVDLKGRLDDDTKRRLYRAFVDHCVILFRNQSLSETELVEATRNFGSVPDYVRPKALQASGQAKLPAQIMLITNIREDGKPIGALPDGEMWFHHDMIHTALPHKATLLYSVQIPTHGGNTRFSNLFAAYDALPDDLKHFLKGKKARNTFRYNSATRDDDKALKAVSEAVHPVVVTHEDTGRKALYVDRLMTHRILDIAQTESDTVLEHLFDHVEKPEFIYDHTWRPGDVVMWDNRSSIHAREDFPADQIRLMWRTNVAGTRVPA